MMMMMMIMMMMMMIDDDDFPRNKFTRSGKCGVIPLANCFNEAF